MSGVVHSVTKVFSKVWDFVRPIVEVVAICAAVYFTAGLALSAFPATAAFAASMPGFAAGGVAGAGVFSTAASSIGLGGGLASGAAAANAAAGIGAAAGAASAAGGLTEIAASDLAPAAVAAAGDTTAAAASTALLPGSVAGSTMADSGAAINATGMTATSASTAAKVGMSLTDKLMLASVGTNALSGFMAPTPADIQKAKNGWYGAFYGVDSNGKGAPAPDIYNGPQEQPGRTYGQSPSSSPLIPTSNTAASVPNAPNMGSGPNMAASAPNMGTLQTPAMPSLMPGVPNPTRAGV